MQTRNRGRNEMNRREFFSNTLWLAGASILASGLAPGLSAQAPGKPAYRPGRYDDPLIFERKPFTWPGGKTLAIWIAPNVEVWDFNSAVGTTISSPTGGVVPDVINYAWRDYGMRVGLWCLADALDVLGVRATVALNSAVCETFPKAVEEMKRRGWEFMGHGISNTTNLAKLSLDQERQVIREVLRTIEQATGKRPRGWLGPGLAETFN